MYKLESPCQLVTLPLLHWPCGLPFPLDIFLGISLLLRRYVFQDCGLGIHRDGGNGKKDYMEASCIPKCCCDSLCWRVRVQQSIYFTFCSFFICKISVDILLHLPTRQKSDTSEL